MNMKKLHIFCPILPEGGLLGNWVPSILNLLWRLANTVPGIQAKLWKYIDVLSLFLKKKMEDRGGSPIEGIF